MPGGIHAPIEVILTWPPPNRVNPETRPNTIFILACVLGPMTISMLFARLWVRLIHQRNAGWDDWLIVVGTIPTIALTVIMPFAVNSSFDRHIWDVEPYSHPEEMVVARKYVLALLCIFCVASAFIKISILLFYRRLSSRVVSTAFRWTTWLTIGFITTYTIALTLAPILGCDPISAFWDQTNINKILKGYKYRCFDEGADVFTASVISAFQDLITAILPSVLFWNLRIPFRQKVALFGIFALGYGVAVLGALRAYYSWHIYYETYDVTWFTWDLFLVTMLELHVGCFCANAPTLKVFFNQFFYEKLTSSLKKSNGSRERSNGQSTGSTKDKSHKSSSSLGEKVAIIFTKNRSGSVDKKGYISDANAGVSVDIHGGVLIGKAFHVDNEPITLATSRSPQPGMRQSTDTCDLFIGRYYDDIEMGNFTTRHNSQASSFYSSSFHPSRIYEGEDNEAVPQMPGSPGSTMPGSPMSAIPPSPRSFIPPSPRSITPCSPRLMEASNSFRFHPLSPVREAFPRLPTPAVILETRNDENLWRYSCPVPQRNLF